MQLLNLPGELLDEIFAWVGPEFFRGDIRRLPISRRWYSFAIVELFKDIEIPLEGLYRLLHSESKEQSLELLRNHAKNISFKTGGLYTLQANRTTEQEKELEPLKQWLRYLHDHHRDIPGILAECTRLQGLSFKAQWYFYQCYEPKNAAEKDSYWLSLLVPGDEIMSTTIRDIISIAYTRNLTSLELDLRGSECVTPRDHDGPGDGRGLFLHLCPLLASLMTRRHMRSLLLSLRCICPVLLQYFTGSPKIWVEEFVLNITPLVGWHSDLCYMKWGCAAPDYFESLAQKMLPRMVRPKVVRVVSHSGPNAEYIDIAYYLRLYDAVDGTSRLIECCPDRDREKGPISLSSLKYY